MAFGTSYFTDSNADLKTLASLRSGFEVQKTIAPREKIDDEQLATIQAVSVSRTEPKTGEIYVVGDWRTARRRVNLSGTNLQGVNVLGRAGKGSAIGGTVGSIVPIFGTAVGSVIGGAIGAVTSIFSKGEKAPRLVSHLQEFLRNTMLESFPNDPFTVGIQSGDNAIRLQNEYPQERAQELILKAIHAFRNHMLSQSSVSDEAKEIISNFVASVKFTTRKPSAGDQAVLMSFKKQDQVFEQTENGVRKTSPDESDTTDRDKQIKAVATGVGALILSRFLF